MKGRKKSGSRRKLPRRNPLAPVVRRLGSRVKPSARSYSRKGKAGVRGRRAEDEGEGEP